MTTRDVLKSGDPVYNERGEHVGEVHEVTYNCFSMRALEGKSLNGSLQVEATLGDGSKGVFSVPEPQVPNREYI